VVIRRPVESVDAYGGESTTWVDACETWGGVSDAYKPTESYVFYADQRVASSTSWWVIRYRAGITPKMRLVFGTRIYDVLSVEDMDERERYLRLLCRETNTEGV
jgi:SPP1 family predicted phage head-tail adaptor